MIYEDNERDNSFVGAVPNVAPVEIPMKPLSGCILLNASSGVSFTSDFTAFLRPHLSASTAALMCNKN